MKTLFAFIFAVVLAPLAHAQGLACSQGTVSTGGQNTPNTSCVPVSMSTGVYVSQSVTASAMATQTICSATTDATDPQYCAAGLYRLELSIVVTQGGTLGQITAANLVYTDDAGTNSANPRQLCNGLSLGAVGRCDDIAMFYHSAGTTVTINTTVGTLGGTPKYILRARAFRAPGS